MPVVNQKAVEQAILVGLALNCSINPMNQFARKNYFYPDLPKGYQISQYDLPVASDGWLEIPDDSGEEHNIRVRAPTWKRTPPSWRTQGNRALVDFNRGGVPLLEIVSEPDMRSAEAAWAYATQAARASCATWASTPATWKKACYASRPTFRFARGAANCAPAPRSRT